MKIAIFAAGTGGHIYPALSIAEKFGEENVIFIASNRKTERKIYKNSGGPLISQSVFWPLFFF